MKRIGHEELKELPFDSKIRVVWHNPCNHRFTEEYYGVIFGDKIGYEDGKIDNVHTIAEAEYNNQCLVYLM